MNSRKIKLYALILWFNTFESETRPSSDSEAATMYKLKRQSSNVQTGQGFKHKEMVRPAGTLCFFRKNQMNEVQKCE